ncbi:MAG: paraquat-inducible protein A [Paracoccaceae bacterium]
MALAVTFFALIAPLLKTVGMALVQFGLLSARAQPVIAVFGKLAMADIFLLALYIVIAKGIGVGQIDVAWGLYLFTGAVVVSLLISLFGKPAAP